MLKAGCWFVGQRCSEVVGSKTVLGNDGLVWKMVWDGMQEIKQHRLIC